MALTDIPLKDVGLSIQMVGAIYADKDREYHVRLPGEVGGAPSKGVLLTTEEWTAFLQQTDLVPVEVLVRDPDTKAVGKAIVRKSERVISQNVSWAVYRRDGFRCRYCGVEDQPLTVDHLVTWESGGPSTPENLVASCKKCNGARGDMAYADWLLTPFYRRVSQNLGYTERFANDALVPTLASIPLSVRVGKRQR